MFTGIIQSIGTLAGQETKGGDVRLYIRTGRLDLADVALGDSIAANGVCLTVVELTGDGFRADVSRETLSLTTLHNLKPGSPLNLEKALTLNSRLGGHLVSGHVDGVGRVVGRREDARSIRFDIEAPKALAKYIAHKGSICVDGASLTVNGIDGNRFDLNIVPHTLKETTLEGIQVGQEVNLEVDLIARYLERLVLGEKASESAVSGVTEALLLERGFIR
ncbi:MAG: riboflavin synthase subunit alpha [Gammaproteobacteria bacterium (ex Lamellibrachia satsuma)]|nr:MAG: riboflavin synthase [Gammaproteobacteria bacterium (ex Lamellibrachia satsuma)]RRS30477.1 MAG: riboflavin synthase subunit alpha [Gammaproteobacteria bacterium (ex Lamellibrachia satsuma)]RRS37309.1 MAG: riboflavin synthase subunit alpha [Gammaproteobacteria bacterium (ex Lamellibrachia satsuma)]